MRAETLAGLANTALALAHLCQAHTFEGYLMAIDGAPTIPAYRLLAAQLAAAGLETPLTLKTSRYSPEDALLRASLTLGSLLCDGFGDAIEVVSDLPSTDALRLSYNILQGARRRISKTEFISCPSCGRTQFDLETTTQRIKSQTSHLTGVKIAIMGCIVNGPGRWPMPISATSERVQERSTSMSARSASSATSPSISPIKSSSS